MGQRSSSEAIDPGCEVKVRERATVVEAGESRIVDHLIYEVGALVRIAAWLQALDEQGPAMLRVACLEACLLHARLLIEFLVGRRSGRKSSDFGANDLLPEWDAHASEKVDVSALHLFLDQLDKALAHLSKTRVVEDGRPESWAIDGTNLVFKSLRVFALELVNAASYPGEALVIALESEERTFLVRPPESPSSSP
jgi:hypothetical protein